MLNPIGDLLARYPTIPILVTSGVIFYAGYVELRKQNRSNGIGWCVWAILILVAYSTTVVYYRMWSSAIAVSAALCIEIAVARSFYRRGQG
jgi:heme/copper-type cytochrome/quinol oxidase subunit 3